MINGNRSFPTLSISQQTADEMLTILGVVALVAAYALLGRNQEARRIEEAVNERRNEDLLKAYQFGRPGHF